MARPEVMPMPSGAAEPARSRLLVPPPVWMLAAAGLQHVIARRSKATPGSIAAAAVVFAGAGALGVSAVVAFRRARTTIDPEHPERATTLVDSGPFARTRNPMYVALATTLVAHAVLRRSLLAFAPVAAFVAVIDRVQIPAEEAALRTTFERAYERYLRTTPRWV